MSRVSLCAAIASLALWAAPAAPQVRVTDVTPLEAELVATRLGAMVPERIAPGAADLMPGDLLSCDDEDAVAVLECPPGSNNSVNLTAPFRVAISVPVEGGCHVDLQAGDADVLDEEDTEVTVGGVEMKAVGTQFAVRVRRGDAGAERRVVVYDGEVEVRGEGEVVRLGRGKMLAFESLPAQRAVVETPAAEVERSARVYSRVDLTKAQRAGPVADSAALQATLERQHYEVLTQPDDQSKRVELAKTQIEYKVGDPAVYNLERAGVLDPAGFAAYRIDASRLEVAVSPALRVYLEERRLASPAPRILVTDVDVVRTTEMDLALIAAGRAEEALGGIKLRLERSPSSARDWHALAKAYDALGRSDDALGAARRALYYAGGDERLGETEVRWSKALVERLGG